ncbi:MAG: threonine--tRNA ligase [archaeon]
MKILSIHSDYLEYEAKKKAIKSAEEPEKRKERIEECLVIFQGSEKPDEGNEEIIAERTVEEIKEIAEKVNTKKIVLYPFVHLTEDPSSPKTAQKIIKKEEELLKETDLEIHNSPFGWYKAFNIKCKGHPLSELSRKISSEKKKEMESEALKAEEELESTWAIMEPNGELHELKVKGSKVKGYNFKGEEALKDFTIYEAGEKEKGGKESPHIEAMKELELVDYEPGSDPGNLRYYPKGKLIKNLLETYVSEEVRNYGAMEIESPIMYDMEHPTLKEYLNRFPARQYNIETPDKNVFLRFAACFGQFLMANDATISYKNLPMRLYELTRYSFRVEQRGELTGLRRLRAFTMPDCHAFCSDLDQVKEEMKTRLKLSKSVLNNIGFKIPEDFELVVRFTRKFYEENKQHIQDIIKEYGKPALVEIWDERFFYFTLKYELNYIDPLGRASALTTDQIDVENGERYGITYTDEDGEEKNPYILHLSPSGAIERVMFAILEEAKRLESEGKKPKMPYWLSPTQLRVIPISEEHLDYAEELTNKFKKVRIDLDDRDKTIGKKIREAEKEWVPYIVVIGSDEIDNEELSVRIRGEEKQLKMKIEELKETLTEEQGNMPFQILPLSKKLSKRPKFKG